MDSVFDILRLQAYQVLTALPALLKAATIFLIGYVLARVLYQVVRRLTTAAGLDRLADRLLHIDLLRKAKWKVQPSRLLAATVYYVVLIIFTMSAVHVLGMDMLSEMIADLVSYLPNAIVAFVVLIGGIFLADFIKKLVLSACRSLGIASGKLIANAIFYFILLNIVLIALGQAQLQTDFMETNISIILAGIAGAFAIGYGMASRHIMSNILSSFYNRNQIRVGDEVSIDGKRGEVIQLNNVSITLQAEDSEYTIPFSKLSSDGFEMHSRRSDRPALPPNLGR